VTLPNVDSRGRCRDCRHRGSLDESATCDHFFLPICLDLNEATPLDRAHVEVSSRMSASRGEADCVAGLTPQTFAAPRPPLWKQGRGVAGSRTVAHEPRAMGLLRLLTAAIGTSRA